MKSDCLVGLVGLNAILLFMFAGQFNRRAPRRRSSAGRRIIC